MTVEETAEICVSQLLAMEPLAGAALALCLAYLNLDWFRYRGEIRSNARIEIDRFRNQDEAGQKALSENMWFRQIVTLAALENNDPLQLAPNNEDDGSSRFWEKFRSDDQKARSDDEMPDGMWSKIYKYLFSRHIDRWITIIGACAGGAAIILASAHGIGMWKAIQCYSTDGYAVAIFWVLALAMLAPILFVLLGRRVVKWGCKFAVEGARSLEHLMLIKPKDKGRFDAVLQEMEAAVAAFNVRIEENGDD